MKYNLVKKDYLVECLPQTDAEKREGIKHFKHIDSASGTTVFEIYVDAESRPHNVGGAAKSAYDPTTGHIISRGFYTHGRLQDQGNEFALTIWDPKTQKLLSQTHYQNGRISCDNGPAHLDYIDGGAGGIRATYYVNGKPLHPHERSCLKRSTANISIPNLGG